jgi:hypothetical protein
VGKSHWSFFSNGVRSIATFYIFTHGACLRQQRLPFVFQRDKKNRKRHWRTRQANVTFYLTAQADTDAAKRHLQRTHAHLVRPDGATYHTYHVDADTGAPLRPCTHQGLADDSCWARGLAWGN